MWTYSYLVYVASLPESHADLFSGHACPLELQEELFVAVGGRGKYVCVDVLRNIKPFKRYFEYVSEYAVNKNQRAEE